MLRTLIKESESRPTPRAGIGTINKENFMDRQMKQPWTKGSAVFIFLVIPLLGSACGARQKASDIQEYGPSSVSTVRHSENEQVTSLATSPSVQPPLSALTAFNHGQKELQAQHYEQAIGWLERAVALDGAQADYYLWLGRAYGYQAQQVAPGEQFFLARKVRKFLEKAVELNPDHLAARLDLLSFYLQAPSLLGGSIDKAKVQAAEIAKRDASQGKLAWQQCQNAEQNAASLFTLTSREG